MAKMASLKYEDLPRMQMPEDAVGMDYPYGARFSICDAACEAVGIDKLPEVGATMSMTAKVVVVGVSDDGMGKRIEFQITDMGLASTGKSAGTMASRLYPRSDD